MATSATSAMDPLLQQYYDMQRRNVNDTYQIGLSENAAAKSMTDLSYQQKLMALQDKLDQEQGRLPDPYAARGLMNSGIWNWNGAGQMGAKQQFAYDSALAKTNMEQQQSSLDSQYGLKNTELGTTNQDSLAGIQSQEAADQARQAASDAIMGA